MHWMIMPFKRYADFSGRSQRKEYWMFILFNWLIILPLFLFISRLEPKETMDAWTQGAVIALLIYIAAIIVPSVAVAVRRFHDQDRSGWFFFLSFIPYVGSIVLLSFMVVDGTLGNNRFGPDPKGRYSGQDDDGDIDHFSTMDFGSDAPLKPPARIMR